MIKHTDSGLSRRLVVMAALTGAAAAVVPVPATSEPLTSLRQAAAHSGLLFGASSDISIINAPDGYAGLFIQNCDLLAPQLAWSLVAPSRSGPDPAQEDPNIAFADAHQMRLTGAHLLWHENIPPWFEEIKSPAEALQAINRHIAAMTARYGSKTFSWNVINEAIEPKDGRADGLRDTRFLRLLGWDYIQAAFRAARDAAPDTILAYNDYGFEANTYYGQRRRTALLKLLDRLQAAQVPIDAVGLQSHLTLAGSRWDAASYRSFLREIAGRGLVIIVSELDVLDLAPAAGTTQMDARIGERYADFLTTALDEPAVAAVVTWGLSDRYTWLTAQRSRYFARPDGAPSRPLPFDAAFTPKPAYYALLAALQHAPPRRSL